MSRETENIERLIKNKGVQFRNFGIACRAAEPAEGEPEKLTVEGTPVVFNSETILFKFEDGTEFREKILPTAFDNCDISDVIFNCNHGGRVYARTRNGSLRLSVGSEDVKMSADIWADDPGHMEFYRDIKRGNIDKMSFAFVIAPYGVTEEKTEDGAILQTVTAIEKLLDVSAVDIPAYDATEISARRLYDAESERQERKDLAESKAREVERRHKLAAKIRIENEALKGGYTDEH